MTKYTGARMSGKTLFSEENENIEIPFDYENLINKPMKKILEQESKQQEQWKLDIEEVRKTIKHPHFKYAVYYLHSKEIKYKWKKPWQWFSGKRIVYVCFQIYPLKCKGLMSGFYTRD